MVFPEVVLLFCLAVLASYEAAILPPAEVSALREIGATLGKEWDFTVEPCAGLSNWFTAVSDKSSYYRNAVTCDCSFINNTICHVTSIVLKAQNLTGTLPPTLTKLPFLQELDLTRNYLNGTIPPEWGSMQLVNISVLGNRLSGPIPRELGNISTLVNLTLDGNMFSGRIPQEIGNLSNSIMLSFSSNYFTGELPQELAKLTTLKDFRISDNQLNGSIPSFIQNWTNLTKLLIQGSGLSGPIPLGIASLTKLTDLRISDLHGNNTIFPSISGATDLKNLILRNCNITGQLPDYLGAMTKLTTLDLSFNKLTGPIPSSYGTLWDVDFIFMAGNLLSGEVPEWVLNRGHAIDLSYNNFSGQAVASECQPRQTNLFASSSEGNTSHIVSCLSSLSCPKSVYSLHINCGGREITVNGTVYEKDMMASIGASMFETRSNWAVSSTGNYLDNNLDGDSYILNSSTMSGTNIELYRNARLSPISMTYYGFCLGNGNYTVNLHFAEIMFTDDNSYFSLGRRFFDIYIQGKLVRKDFNIKDEAGGNYRPVVRKFTAVVNENTLEIRFFFAGKGTTNLPVRGVYGPLISAISVEQDFKPPRENGDSLSAGAIFGIVIGVVAVVSAVPIILWWLGCFQNRETLKYGNV